MKQGWELKILGGVCKFQNGFAFKSKTFKDEGVPVLRISNIQKDNIDLRKIVFVDPSDYKEDLSKYVVNKGDLLIAMSGATTGKIGFNNTDDVFYLNQRVGKFKPSEQLNIRYLYYFLSTQVEENLNISAGSAQPNLSTQQIKSFKLPIPPLEEQKQIVAKLDQCFEAIDKARANVAKNLENAKELFQSKLNNIFSQKGEGWVEKRLGDVCEKIQDGAHHSPKVQYDEKASGRYLYITSKNIRNNYLKLDKVSYVDEEFHNTIYHRCTPEFGDILLTKDGANTGNITLNTLREPFSLLSSVCLIKTNRDLLLPNFLKFYIQSPIGFKKITGSMTGTAIKRIVLKTIKKSTMPMPDINTQKQLVAQLNIIYGKTQSLEAKYKTELNSLEELKKSILQKAFEGEL